MTETGVVRTKHVRMLETEFPGIAPTFEDRRKYTGDYEVVEKSVDFDLSSVLDSDRPSETSQSGGDEPPDYKDRTYTPAKPSSLDESHDETNKDSECPTQTVATRPRNCHVIRRRISSIRYMRPMRQ